MTEPLSHRRAMGDLVPSVVDVALGSEDRANALRMSDLLERAHAEADQLRATIANLRAENAELRKLAEGNPS